MRLEEGRVPGCSLLSLPEGLRAARSAVPRARRAWALAGWRLAKTRGLGLTERGRQEAAPSPVEPPGKKAGAQQDGWVWIVVLFFLFVAFLGTKKKAQPFTPLHLHLSRPETQPQWLGGTETTVCLAPHNSGWVGRAFLLGPAPGLLLSQSTTEIWLIIVLPNLAPISLPALGWTLATRFNLRFSFRKNTTVLSFEEKEELKIGFNLNTDNGYPVANRIPYSV